MSQYIAEFTPIFANHHINNVDEESTNSDSSNNNNNKELKAKRAKLAQLKSKTYQIIPSRWSQESGEKTTAQQDKKPKLLKKLKSSLSSKSLWQRLFPANFSLDSDLDLYEPRGVYLNVYRINDKIGFYHTGIVLFNAEFTFCQDAGICQHEPRKVAFAKFLGSVRLGMSEWSEMQFQLLLADMEKNGFAVADYHIMRNSCNCFTEETAKRLGLLNRYEFNCYLLFKILFYISDQIQVFIYRVNELGNQCHLHYAVR